MRSRLENSLELEVGKHGDNVLLDHRRGRRIALREHGDDAREIALTIAELEHGRIVAQAPYDKLLQCSQSFRRMALATKSI